MKKRTLNTVTDLEDVVCAMQEATSLEFVKTPGELLVAVDLETSGLSPERNQVLSVYCHVVHRVIEYKEPLYFDALVRLEESRFKIDPEAMKVNGLSRDILELDTVPTWEQVTFKLREWLGTLYVSLQAKCVTLISYSGRHFDSSFLHQGFRLAKLQVPSWLRFADAYNVVQQLVPGEMLQLPINPQTGRRIQKQVTVFHQLTPYFVPEKLLHSAKADTLLLVIILLTGHAKTSIDTRSSLLAYVLQDRDSVRARSFNDLLHFK